MKILHQKAGPEEAVGLTKEDREYQVRQKTNKTKERQGQRQRQRIATFQVPIIRSNVISALEVSQQSVLL